MSNQLRFQVVEEAFKKKALEVPTPSERPSAYFGKYVFNREKMYRYLPAEVYTKLIDVIDNGARLDRSIADAVAEGMKRGTAFYRLGESEEMADLIQHLLSPGHEYLTGCDIIMDGGRTALGMYPQFE